MDKQSLVNDLRHFTGRNFANVTQIAKFLGVKRESAAALMRGVDYYDAGRAKNYYIRDVAERIMQNRAI